MSTKAQVIEHTDIVPAQSGALTPMDMLNRAVSQGANIEVLEKLMALQERWEANQARKAFDAAMAEAKAEIPVIFKNRTVSYGTGKTSYKHEDMAEVARTVDPILGKHGLSYRFRSQTSPEHISVTCIVFHRDGHSEENTVSAQPDTSGSKNSIQAIGSAMSYLQRYSLKAALGLAASADDDGRAAGSGSDGPISDTQAEQLTALIAETKSDIDRFLKWAGAPSISDIRTSQFADCLAMLKTKQRKAAK